LAWLHGKPPYKSNNPGYENGAVNKKVAGVATE
jgi:hypothetical protein